MDAATQTTFGGGGGGCSYCMVPDHSLTTNINNNPIEFIEWYIYSDFCYTYPSCIAPTIRSMTKLLRTTELLCSRLPAKCLSGSDG